MNPEDYNSIHNQPEFIKTALNNFMVLLNNTKYVAKNTQIQIVNTIIICEKIQIPTFTRFGMV